jgi:hypothetical protein
MANPAKEHEEVVSTLKRVITNLVLPSEVIEEECQRKELEASIVLEAQSQPSVTATKKHDVAQIDQAAQHPVSPATVSFTACDNNEVAELKSYELTPEYQMSIEPLLEKLADELKFSYSYDDSPHKRGRYRNNAGEVERERHVKIEIYLVSKETIEKIAQAICELKDGHKKQEQECVAIKEIVGVQLYENKNLEGRARSC